MLAGWFIESQPRAGLGRAEGVRMVVTRRQGGREGKKRVWSPSQLPIKERQKANSWFSLPRAKKEALPRASFRCYRVIPIGQPRDNHCFWSQLGWATWIGAGTISFWAGFIKPQHSPVLSNSISSFKSPLFYNKIESLEGPVGVYNLFSGSTRLLSLQIANSLYRSHSQSDSQCPQLIQ